MIGLGKRLAKYVALLRMWGEYVSIRATIKILKDQLLKSGWGLASELISKIESELCYLEAIFRNPRSSAGSLPMKNFTSVSFSKNVK